jgi:hypothetical protein
MIRTLIRLAIVAAAFFTFPAAVFFLTPRYGDTHIAPVILTLLVIPASAVIAMCVANSFHRADQTIAAAERFQAEHGQPTDHDTTGETR